MKIRSVEPLSVGRIMAAIYGGLGVMIGSLFAAISVIGGLIALNQQGPVGSFPPVAFGIAAIFFLPLVYGVLGFVSGALSAVLYNLAARIMGGIEVELGE
jgi:hypothetical protein